MKTKATYAVRGFKTGGNSEAYLLRRLKRDAPELAERVWRANDASANAPRSAHASATGILRRGGGGTIFHGGGRSRARRLHQMSTYWHRTGQKFQGAFLWLACYTQEEIAEREGLPQRTVADILAESATLPDSLKPAAAHLTDFEPPILQRLEAANQKRREN